ncbi:MAG: glutathione-disulfide reductase [Legionellales bacterium]|nr:glutathione-disulfide reductase [Legionellales bacterium]
MYNYDYDLFVIGAGSGGVRAARMSASYGARVGIAEERYLGGTCVNVGCVPKKLLVYASHVSEEIHNAKGFGWDIDHISYDWSKLIKNKNTEIQRLNGIYKNLLENTGVDIINGRATIIDAHTVEIGTMKYSAEKILIATGGWPSVPDIPGKKYIISSNEAFFLESLPKKIIIVGGGYIAVEFAGIFNGLGVETTLIHRGSLFLRGFDQDLRSMLAEEMQKKEIKIIFNVNVKKIDKTDKQLVAYFEDGTQLEADQIMYATGRKPMTENLGLENVGIEINKKNAIKINDDYQTNIPSIYAIGDVTDRINLTPVALAEGMALAKRFFANEKKIVNYSDIPTCVFSQPSLGTVGLTEEQARKKYVDIDIYKSRFTPMKYSLSDNNEKTMMKMIVEKKTNRVIGVHMIGPDAGEIIQGIGIAMKAGASKQDFDSTIGIHPTAAEEFVSMREPTI